VNTKTLIFNSAVRLFASQGYEATTTLKVARQIGISEPAIFYYYENKNALYTAILEVASSSYLQRLDSILDSINDADQTAFRALEALIKMHFSIVEQEPQYTRILLRACPTRLQDHENGCMAIYQSILSKLKETTTLILEKGAALREFQAVDIDATANMIIALLKGLMLQQIGALEKLDGVEAATIAFCATGLINQPDIKKRRLKVKKQDHFDPI
jgi:TetR/AcrR family transcriptional regulator